MTNDDIIKTSVFRSNVDFLTARSRRIDESLSFQGGSNENPTKHIISTLPNDKEAYFLKPGKEASRKNPNVNDMSVWVGNGGNNEFMSYTFEDIWKYLVEVSILNRLLFKQVLVLLYRLCYFIDHLPDDNNNLRYSPSPKLLQHINKMDFAIQHEFKDKFKKDGKGLLEYLYFIDLLAWNEDVKYHSNHREDFGTKEVGRPNTIISVISVPLMVDEFVSNIIRNVDNIEKINVRLILSAMQKLSKSRGICVLSHTKLQEHLKPYLTANK